MKVATECRAYQHHKLRGIWSNTGKDILRFLTKSPENRAAGDGLKTRLSAFLRPELQCLFLYRVAHYLHVRGWWRAAIVLTRINFLVHKANITPESCIGPAARVPHPAGLTFCGRAGRGVTIFALSTCCPSGPFGENSAHEGPVLGDDVMVGGHSVVVGPLQIADSTKISFGVRLARDTPRGVLVVARTMRGKALGQSQALLNS
jgi:serine O-acetyltransferase